MALDSGLVEAPADALRLERARALAAQLSALHARREQGQSSGGSGGGGGDCASGCCGEGADSRHGGSVVAIVAVSGWDSCWHAESAALLDWLCGGAAPPDAFAVITPTSAAVLAPAPAEAAAEPSTSQQQQQQRQQDEGSGARSRGGTPHGDAPGAGHAGAAGDSDGQSSSSSSSSRGGDEEAAALAELATDPKIATFRRLLAAARPSAVAVPLGWEVASGRLRHAQSSGGDGGDDAGGGEDRAVESGAAGGEEPLGRWPLVQALRALEGPAAETLLGARVLDATHQVRALMGAVDARAARALLSDNAPALRRAWVDLMAAVAKRSPVARGVELTEEQLLAPLLAHAQSSRAASRGIAPWSYAPLCMPPRVLFGTRTADPRAMSDARDMRQHASDQGRPVLHAVVEAADGASCLRLARTVVFTHGQPPDIPGADPGSLKGSDAAGLGDGALLLRWSAAVADAAHAAMHHFATKPDATVASTRVAARNALISSAAALKLHLVVPEIAAELRVALIPWDSQSGLPAGAGAGAGMGGPAKGDGRPKTLKVTLGGVRGAGGAALGAVAYADTFVEVPAGPNGEPSDLINLTEGVAPELPTFACHGVEAASTLLLMRLWQRTLQANSPLCMRGETRSPPLLAASDAAAPPLPPSLQRAAVAPGVSAATAAAAAAPAAGRTVPVTAGGGGGGAAGTGEPRGRARRKSTGFRGGRAGGAAAAAGPSAGGAADDAAAAHVTPAATAGMAGPLSRPALLGPRASLTDQLGELLLPSPEWLAAGAGPPDAAICTGCPHQPVLSGPIYFFARGAVIVTRATRLFALQLSPAQIESVSVQDLPALPPSAGPGAAAPLSGRCVVLRGRRPACGVSPACLLTSNPHMLLPLAPLQPVVRGLLEATVLPAWRAACAQMGIPFHSHPPPTPAAPGGDPAGSAAAVAEPPAAGVSAAAAPVASPGSGDPPVPWVTLAQCAYRLNCESKQYATPLADEEVDALARRLLGAACGGHAGDAIAAAR